MHLSKQWKTRTLGVAVGAALISSSAFAAQNVANTAQKGSLMMFPNIDIRRGTSTIIRIANDANSSVNVKCYYVNETKGRADFQFVLTKKQAMVWNAESGEGDPRDVTPFPTYSEIPTVPAGSPPTAQPLNPYVGELVCFAVNAAGSHQISFNHLSGTSTVYDYSKGTAFEYNSWNFTARGVAANRTVGTAGRLELSGAAGAYDACPAYNIVHFAPISAEETYQNAESVGYRRHMDTQIAVSSCKQDLTQDFVPVWTKIEIPVWNAQEVKFTGAYECSNSTHIFNLSDIDVLPSNTTYDVLGTKAAHLSLTGVGSTQCPLSQPAGLVAVAASLVSYSHDGYSEHYASGTTTNHAGVSTDGFVLWDPAIDSVPEAR